MTKSKVIGLSLLLLILFGSLALAESDCLYYFYGEGCNDCNVANAKIAELQTKYPSLNVQQFEIYFNRENAASLNEYFKAYGIAAEQQGVPVIFSATSYFVGQKAITELLDTHIAENDNSACPTTAGSKVVGVVGKTEPLTLYKSLTLTVVGKAAIANYLSAGILTFISVMLLFTVILVASGNSKRKVFKKNFWFVVAGLLVYLAYLLGLFTWFGQENVASLSFKIVAIMVVLLSLLMLRRHLVGKGELFENMAHAQQQSLKFYRNVIFSTLGVFILGIITALFTLAGTSKEFGWMRGLIEMREGTGVVSMLGIFYLIVLFLLPLVVSFLLFLIREGGEDAGERGQWIWKKKELWWVNSIVAIVAVVLGIVVLFL